ncbi:MAG TPA: hypothetical protein VMV44_13430 [Rectinemataceae bacterium]|nr:hypothetical protein [Rectinemataceae bacterium]
MAVKLVLNGGIKSCCSVTPTEVVARSLREWLPDSVELIVIDRARDEWRPDSLAIVASMVYQDDIFPLVYIDDTLAMIGGIPKRNTLIAMLKREIEYGISKDDILDVARRRIEAEMDAEVALA